MPSAVNLIDNYCQYIKLKLYDKTDFEGYFINIIFFVWDKFPEINL